MHTYIQISLTDARNLVRIMTQVAEAINATGCHSTRTLNQARLMKMQVKKLNNKIKNKNVIRS